MLKYRYLVLAVFWILNCNDYSTDNPEKDVLYIDFSYPIACVCHGLSMYAYEDSLNYKLIISVHDSIINGYQERNVGVISDGVILKVEQYSITPFHGPNCTDIWNYNNENQIVNEYIAISGKIYISFQISNLIIDTISYGEFIDTINIQLNQIQLINNETDSSFILSDQEFMKLNNWGCAG
jgi:hypothetical protein